MSYWNERILKGILETIKFIIVLFLMILFVCISFFLPYALYLGYNNRLFLLLYSWVPLLILFGDYREWTRKSDKSYWSKRFPKVFKETLPKILFFALFFGPFMLSYFVHPYIMTIYLVYIPFIIHYDWKNWKKQKEAKK